VKKIKIFRKILEIVVEITTISMFLLLFSIGVYAFYDANSVMESGVLDEVILATSPEKNEDEKTPLGLIKAINDDAVGWIKIFDTKINHPIMQSHDNSDYLVQDYKKEYSSAGSVFTDFRNDGFNNDFTIIYGHRMSEGLMFSDVTKYYDEQFFNEHLRGRLWTEKDVYDFQVIGFAVFNVGQSNIYSLDEYLGNSGGAYAELSKYMLHNSNYEYQEGDKLLLLSTCDGSGRHKRDVLLGKLVKK